MAASAAVDVVGTAPISFTDSTGAQKSVPLSALEFSGSALQVTQDPAKGWVTELKPPDAKTLLAVANARLAAGELTPPPVRPPSPAIAVTAVHPGPESNNIVVTAAITPDPDHPGQPLSATIKFTATETDMYAGLSTATDVAKAIGVDIPSGQDGAPLAGTGLVVVKSSSVATANTLPADHQHAVLTPAGFEVKAADSSVLFTLVPRAGYSGSGGLSADVALHLDPSGATTFTVTATYDSAAESGTQPEVTILTLNALPSQVAYLVTAGAPPAGAMLPAAGPPIPSVQLSGGGPGVAASGLFYTPDR
jgi:hypothetical protein